MIDHKPYIYIPKSIRVVDGDTLDVVLDLGFSITVKVRLRLHGVDTPEIYGVKKESAEYARGKEASKRVQELLDDAQYVLIRTYKHIKEKYGRYLADVYMDHKDPDDPNVSLRRSLGDILIEEGHATAWER